MAKHVVQYSDYYLEEIQRQYDSASGIPSRGGRTKYGTVDREEMADNRKQVISRDRKKITRYVMHNFRPKQCHMITFTLRSDIEWAGDLKACIKQFRWFLKRLRRYWEKNKVGYILKYIYVTEFHKNRDALHFHMISDMPQSVLNDLSAIWNHGFTHAKLIKDREHLLRATGYLGKSFSDERLGRGVDLFWKSKSVRSPNKFVDDEASSIMNSVNTDEGELVSSNEYETEYQGHTLYQSWAFDNARSLEQLRDIMWP